MIEWMKHNKEGLVVVVGAILLIAVLAYAQGCAIEDMVRMTTTPKMQQVTGAAPVISVGDYPDVRADFVQSAAKELERNDAEYARQSFWVDFIRNSVSVWQPVAEAGAATVPGGTILTGLLFGAGGLLMRKPGDGKIIDQTKQQAADALLQYQRDLAAEKMKSYNKGLAVGKGTA